MNNIAKVTDNIWIGNSDAEKSVGRTQPPINCVLVVAHDMVPTNNWRRRAEEYMQVGLIDGPGNPLAAYHAAVLALATLVRRRENCRILVCDHGGGRSLAVVVMYLYLVGDGPSWDECIERLKVREKDLPTVHDMHRKAFFLMDWSMLSRVLDGEVSDG